MRLKSMRLKSIRLNAMATSGALLVAAVGLTATASVAAALVAAAAPPSPAGQPAPLAYIGSDGRIAFVRNGNIFSIKPDGTGLAKLTHLGHASGPRWSPNGT